MTTRGHDLEPHALAQQAVHLRVDVSPDHEATWVKITRLSTGKVIAQKSVDAGGHLGGGALQDDYGFAIESGIPGNVRSPSTGTTFSLNGTGPGLARHGGHGGRARRAGPRSRRRRRQEQP